MYTKNKDGTFTVTSASHPEQSWIVNADITACNCPKFRFILRGHGSCHHMDEVRKGENLKAFAEPTDSKFEKFNIKTYTEPLHIHNFMEKYGDSQLDVLIAMQQVFIDKGRVRRLA